MACTRRQAFNEEVAHMPGNNTSWDNRTLYELFTTYKLQRLEQSADSLWIMFRQHEGPSDRVSEAHSFTERANISRPVWRSGADKRLVVETLRLAECHEDVSSNGVAFNYADNITDVYQHQRVR